MIKNRLKAFMLIMGSVLSISAQEQTKAIARTFKSGWFIGANSGMNLFMGEGNNFLSSSKPFVSPIHNVGFLGRFAVGYNFTPIVGLRGMLGYHALGYCANCRRWKFLNN